MRHIISEHAVPLAFQMLGARLVRDDEAEVVDVDGLRPSHPGAPAYSGMERGGLRACWRSTSKRTSYPMRTAQARFRAHSE